MYSQKRYDSPPDYSPPTYLQQKSQGPGSYGYHIQSAHPDSFYQEDIPPQHFYKWTSPPGIVRILQGIVVLLCLAIFACVASTLAWQYNYGLMGGMGGMSGLGGYGYGGYGYGGYLGGYGGYGYGYGTTNPQAASGFMMAMSVLTFIAELGLFIASVTKSGGTQSRKFFMIILVLSAVLATLDLIASIVYIVGVNPRAQSGGMYYSQMMAMCNQFYSPVSSGAGIMNEYLYHYCMVDPQEAIAIVCGFIVVILLCVTSFFAQKTRSKIWRYGEPNIYWEKPFEPYQEGPNVEEWVKSVPEGPPDETATIVYSEKSQNPLKALSNTSIYKPPKHEFIERVNSPSTSSPPISVSETQEQSRSRPPLRRGRRWRRNPELDEYETDYTTAFESGDEKDEEEWDREYPSITSDNQRLEYKREFDSDLKKYKKMCAEMDDINTQLQQLNKQLDGLSEGTAQYQGVAEEYNRLKDLKRTPDYQTKKSETKQLRNKLFHIKRMVNAYDKGRG